jgi:type IV conjugative transfer system protein TraE
MEKAFVEKEITLLEKSLKREKGIRYILLALVVVLLFAFMGKKSETITVLAPVAPGIDADCKLVVSANRASECYLEKMTDEMINLSLIYTPGTYQKKHDQLLQVVDPRDYGAMKKMVISQHERIKRSNISSVFFPTEYRFNLNTNQVVVRGIYKNYSGERLILNEDRSYRFDYSIIGHRLKLKGFFDVTGLRNPFEAEIGEGFDD